MAEIGADKSANAKFEKNKTPKGKTRRWVIWIGRVGYVAMAIVHLLVGFLALLSVFGSASAIGTRGALRQIAALPFGKFLLGAVSIGLLCHAVWRTTQTVLDTDGRGSDAKGLLVRAGFSVIALVYLGLAFSAVRVILGVEARSGKWAESWTAFLLAQPFGQWLVGIAAAIAAGVGIFQFYQAGSAKFRETLRLTEMSEKQSKWATAAGRIGYAARGIVFCIIAFFLVFAAVNSDAGATRGFGGALDALELQPYGRLLVGAVAGGLLVYGIFMLVLMRFRRMSVVKE